jgi:hypothetical protein
MIDIMKNIYATGRYLVPESRVNKAIVQAFSTSFIHWDIHGVSMTGHMRVDEIKFRADGGHQFWIIADAFVKTPGEYDDFAIAMTLLYVTTKVRDKLSPGIRL